MFAHQGVDQPDFYGQSLHSYSNSNTPIQDMVEIYLGCADSGISTLDGSIIRFLLADSAGSKATFDIPSSLEERGGYVTDTWVHVALSVDHRSIKTFIDGRTAPLDQIGFSPASYETDWAQTDANLAYPDPSALTGALTRFALSGGSDGPILGAARTSGYGMRPFAGSITFVTLWFQALDQVRKTPSWPRSWADFSLL